MELFGHRYGAFTFHNFLNYPNVEPKQRPFIHKKKRLTFKSEDAQKFIEIVNKTHDAQVVSTYIKIYSAKFINP